MKLFQRIKDYFYPPREQGYTPEDLERARKKTSDIAADILKRKPRKTTKTEEVALGYRVMFDNLKSKGLDISTIKLNDDFEENRRVRRRPQNFKAVSSDKTCRKFPTKKTYASLKQAKRALKNMGYRFGNTMAYYKCPACHMWHLTTTR